MARRTGPTRISITRYTLPDGTRCTRDTPGAVAHKTKSETYYGWIKTDGKSRRVSLGTSDLGQAWVELRRQQRRAVERAAGIADDYTDQAGRPLEQHLADWLADVAASGTSAEQVEALGAHLRRLAGLAGWSRLGDLTAGSLLRALVQLQAGEEGVSAQTRNHYTRHAKQFARWCCRSRPRRLIENPFEAVSLVSVEADRRHDRRAPSDDEIARLFEHLATVPDTGRRWQGKDRKGHFDTTPYWRRDMSAPQRALGYKLAMATGYRAGELRSLTPASFDLERATVTVRAAYSKRRRTDTQELPGWLVEELREWFAAGGGCWAGFPANHPGRILRDDLEAAGVPYVVEGPDGPRFCDFHSLRFWYITQLANLPNISPKTLMMLARHSTPSLTLVTYAKAKVTDLRAAVDQIPEPGKREERREDAR